MRIIFDLDSDNWVEMIDSDVEALISVDTVRDKKRVKVILLLDDDMMMDNRAAEDTTEEE